jgi:DNA-binding transcriptional MerR regulator
MIAKTAAGPTSNLLFPARPQRQEAHMEFDKTELAKMADLLQLNDDIRLADIPDIELYMEQLLTLLNGKLRPFGREPGDKALTKTMINNYTKFQLIPPPRNKKYSKEHLLLLILIHQLKNVLSISDIRRLLRPILKDISTPDDDIMPLGQIYSSFLELKTGQFDDFCDNLAAKMDNIDHLTTAIEHDENRNTATVFLLVLMLIAQANAAKALAERIIDICIPPVVAGQDEKSDGPRTGKPAKKSRNPIPGRE